MWNSHHKVTLASAEVEQRLSYLRFFTTLAISLLHRLEHIFYPPVSTLCSLTSRLFSNSSNISRKSCQSRAIRSRQYRKLRKVRCLLITPSHPLSSTLFRTSYPWFSYPPGTWSFLRGTFLIRAHTRSTLLADSILSGWPLLLISSIT